TGHPRRAVGRGAAVHVGGGGRWLGVTVPSLAGCGGSGRGVTDRRRDTPHVDVVDQRSERSMRRGMVSVPDARLRRRTVTTLPEELRVRGVQVLSSFRERIGLALSGGMPRAARTPRGVVRALPDDPTRTVGAARRRLAEALPP